MKNDIEKSVNHNRYDIIDLAKFILSIMVVLVHCDCIRGYGAIGNLVIREGICRTTVPIFFAFSGCLLSLGGWNYTRFTKQLKKVLILYLKWSLIYFLFKLMLSIVNNNYNSIFFDELWNTIFIAENYHLWYLLALVYAIIVLIIVLKIKEKITICKNNDNFIVYIFVIGFLWIVCCLHYTYNWVGKFCNTSLDLTIYKFEGIFNAIFYAIPMIMIGRLSAMNYKKQTKTDYICKLILAVIIYFAELFLLYYLVPTLQNYTVYLSTPLLVYFLLSLLMNIRITINKKYTKFFRELSLYIYCIHPMIIVIWNSYIKRDGVTKFCAVLLLSFIISLIIYSVKYLIKKTKKEK